MTATFRPQGLLAVDPRALGLEFLVGNPTASAAFTRDAEGLATVHVCGPLVYAGWLFDSYDGVKARVAAALADADTRVVVLKINSPGGEVSGAFDCARSLRAMALAARKPLLAFTEAQCCSAAYALASAASSFTASDSAEIGSIGVIGAMCDETAKDAALGVRYAVIASGNRKSDSNPHVPLSEDAIAAAQVRVDDMASVFFDLVREFRGVEAEKLQAGVFVGRAALAKGLIDGVETWDALKARAAGAILSETGATGAEASAETKSDNMPDPKEDEKSKAAKAEDEKSKAAKAEDDSGDEKEEKDAVRRALVKAAGDDSADPKARARARKALEAYEKEDEKEAADDSEKKDASAAALAASAPAAVILALAESDRRLAALEAERTSEKVSAFYASRPDLPEAVVAELKKLPLAQAISIASKIPVSGANPLVAQTAAPLSGTTTDVYRPGAKDPHGRDLDVLMGLTSTKSGGSSYDPLADRLTLGIPVVSTPKVA